MTEISLEDAKAKIKELEDYKRRNLIKNIKKFGDKYSDEELSTRKVDDLEIILDAMVRFEPALSDPDVLPITSPPEPPKNGERIDFAAVWNDVNAQFNMSKYKTKESDK